MISAVLEKKAKLLQNQIEYKINTIMDINKTVVSEIVKRSSRLTTFSLFDMPREYFNKFSNYISNQISSITQSVNIFRQIHDKVDSIGRVASSVFSGITGSISDFSTLLGTISSQLTSNLSLQNNVWYPTDWILNDPSNDYHSEALANGWEYHADTNRYTKITGPCPPTARCLTHYESKSADEIKNLYSKTYQERLKESGADLKDKYYCKPGWESFCKNINEGLGNPKSQTWCKAGWESFCKAANEGFSNANNIKGDL